MNWRFQLLNLKMKKDIIRIVIQMVMVEIKFKVLLNYNVAAR